MKRTVYKISITYLIDHNMRDKTIVSKIDAWSAVTVAVRVLKESVGCGVEDKYLWQTMPSNSLTRVVDLLG